MNWETVKIDAVSKDAKFLNSGEKQQRKMLKQVNIISKVSKEPDSRIRANSRL